MPADILLYALIAAGLVFWLKNILGTRDEDESDHGQKRPSIFSDSDEDNTESSFKRGESNVVSLEALMGAQPIANLPRHVRIDNKTTENALEEIIKDHENFDLNHFADGAEQAFQIIIEAFADGDLETLKNLLDDNVYQAFEEAIKERQKREESVTTDIQSIEKLDITEVAIEEDILKITVRFTAREICVIRDKAGEIVSGDPEKITQMVDVWVFGRDVNAEGPEWFLYETRDDEIEDHKTPVPEGGAQNKKNHKKDSKKDKK